MDNVPSRILLSNSTVSLASSQRAITSRGIPKLCGKQVKKQIPEQNSNNKEKKSNTNLPASRIPLKRFVPKTSLGTVSQTATKIANPVSSNNSSKISVRQPGNSFIKPPTTARRSSSSTLYKSPRLADLLNTKTKVAAHSGDGAAGLSAHERVTEKNKLLVFEGTQKKLQEVQTDFLTKYYNLNNLSQEKIKGEFKLIALVKDDDKKLIVKDDCVNLPKKVKPQQQVKVIEQPAEFSDKMKDYFDNYMNNFHEKLLSAVTENSEWGKKEKEAYDNLCKEQKEYFYSVLDSWIEKDKRENILQQANIDFEFEKQTLQSEMKIEMQKMKDTYEKQLSEIKTHYNETTARQLAQKDERITNLTTKLKTVEAKLDSLNTNMNHNTELHEHALQEKEKLRDQVAACKDNIQTLSKKLISVEMELNNERKEKLAKIECFRQLEGELIASKQKIEEIRAKKNADINSHYIDQQNEIANLKDLINETENGNKELKDKINILKDECHRMDELKEKLRLAEERIRALEFEIQEKTTLLDSSVLDLPRDVQTEVARLRQSEAEKRREIEKLKIQVSKAQYTILQLEEQIHRDKQLLDVRSELISSLQTNDTAQRSHLEELFVQVGEKNQNIHELNNELITKSEEFRNLFTTLSAKQMELSRQEHIIKLLEESNERSQMLRVKQEEKIARMEEEIVHLKQTIIIHQKNISNNVGAKNLSIRENSAGVELIDRLLIYQQSREGKRRRESDISVKKYDN